MPVKKGWARFKELLANRGFTQQSFAEKLGISVSSVQNFASRIPSQHWERVAELLGISESQLGTFMQKGMSTRVYELRNKAP